LLIVRVSILLLFFLFHVPGLHAQAGIKVLVPDHDLVQGESFRLQYLWRSKNKNDEFKEPALEQFRLVKSPENSDLPLEDGSNEWQHIVSLVLEPLQAGRVRLPVARVLIGNQLTTSSDQYVIVISKQEADRRLQAAWNAQKGNPNLMLKEGEDPQRKINEGLFITVEADRQSVWVGQPVTATFKLYSSLRSQSDIVKNPAFYGFAVQEMIGLKEGFKETKQLNGRSYEVHTLRKVQLYPQSAGQLSIDPMELSSKVWFSRKPVNEPATQQILEGVVEDNDDEAIPGWELFEVMMRSSPLTIRVKALPEAKKPKEWSGAVGRFSIDMQLGKENPAAREENQLDITISGKGNFLQLVAPKVEWPKGIDGFGAIVLDQLDSSKAPMQGQRRFRMRFVADQSGEFSIPAIRFSYFDPDSNRYVTVASKALNFFVAPAIEKKDIPQNESAPESGSFDPSRIYLIAIVILVVLGVVYTWRRESKKEKIPAPIPPPAPALQISEALSTAADKLEDPANFYSALYQGIWRFLNDRIGVSAVATNKFQLWQRLQPLLPEEERNQLWQIMELCEIRLYTAANEGDDRQSLLATAIVILKKIDEKPEAGSEV
jgi:hypothetical protein